MKLLTSKEIDDLRIKEASLKDSTRIAKQRKELERKMEIRKGQLDQRLRSYKAEIAKEIKEAKVERDLLLNEVAHLKAFKVKGLNYAQQLITEAQEVRILASKKLSDAINVEKYVEGKIARLESFKEEFKKLKANFLR
jgi:hypothetical protein